MDKVVSEYTFWICVAGTTHVAGVIGAVKVNPVPARRKEGFRPESEACHRGKTVEIRRIVLPQAHMLYSLLREACFVKCAKGWNIWVSCDRSILQVDRLRARLPKSWISDYHSQPRRRGCGIKIGRANSTSRSIIASPVQVVYSLIHDINL